MHPEVKRARAQLLETLRHWKDGTRPGDDPVTEADVVNTIDALIEARIIAYDAARDHSR